MFFSKKRIFALTFLLSSFNFVSCHIASASNHGIICTQDKGHFVCYTPRTEKHIYSSLANLIKDLANTKEPIFYKDPKTKSIEILIKDSSQNSGFSRYKVNLNRKDWWVEFQSYSWWQSSWSSYELSESEFESVETNSYDSESESQSSEEEHEANSNSEDDDHEASSDNHDDDSNEHEVNSDDHDDDNNEHEANSDDHDEPETSSDDGDDD